MKVKAKLLRYFDLGALVVGIRMSRDSEKLSDSYENDHDGFVLGNKDKQLIEKCLQNDEGSVFEHLVYQFKLTFPRAVLQEFSRHRMGISPTVKSTRFTLDKDNVLDNYYDCDDPEFITKILSNIKHKLDHGWSNDEVKPFLPEGFMTEGIYTINARALNHLFRLRHRKKVYKPFYELCEAIYNELPEQHKFIFEGSYNEG